MRKPVQVICLRSMSVSRHESPFLRRRAPRTWYVDVREIERADGLAMLQVGDGGPEGHGHAQRQEEGKAASGAEVNREGKSGAEVEHKPLDKCSKTA